MPYPNLLATGVTLEGTFDPTELYAGDADVISDSGAVGASAIAQFQPVSRAEDGLIMPWDPLAGAANKAGTFSGVGTAADTITVNAVVFTLTASPAVSTDVLIGGTATATAINFAAAVNANPDTTMVRAVQAAAVVTLYAIDPGAAGNAIAISESSTNFSFAGGATALSGGTAEPKGRAIGIAAQAAPANSPGIPYFTAGVFNSDIIVWPATITTLAQRKAAFDRTDVHIAKLKGVSTKITYP